MIGHLRGEIIDIGEKTLLLSVAGVGYTVFVTEDTIHSTSIGDTLSCYTHLSVRENALDLFGFLLKEELRFFELLITVSGIGPKSALSILNIAALPTLRSAIATGDTGYLTKVSGIGRKTAEKIVLELRDKVGALGETRASTPALKEESDALLALMSLGYNERDAREVLKNIAKPGSTTQDIVREALKHLGK